MSDIRKHIYDAIDAERTAQDAQWGGSVHDDTHEAPDWFDYIEYQSIALLQAWEAGGVERGNEVRSRLVKMAALAVAGIESHDRKIAAQAAQGETGVQV